MTIHYSLSSSESDVETLISTKKLLKGKNNQNINRKEFFYFHISCCKYEYIYFYEEIKYYVQHIYIFIFMRNFEKIPSMTFEGNVF